MDRMNITSFSFSAISTFKSCPRAFEYKYVKKLPEAFSSIEAHMGTKCPKMRGPSIITWG